MTDEQAARLRRQAAATGRSMADLVREAVDRLAFDPSPREVHERAMRAVRAHTGDGARAGAEHDRYLDEAGTDWRRS